MSSYEYALRSAHWQLKSLPWRRFWRRVAAMLYPLWEPFYRQLAWIIAGKSGVRGELWRMFHTRKWQLSSLESVGTWLLGTLVVYKLVAKLGYGWEINIAVSLAFDGVGWAIHKRWIFDDRDVTCVASYGRNTGVWVFFFFINLLLAILVFHLVPGGTLWQRGVLGIYGIFINPVMFKIRDRIIFAEANPWESTAAWRSLEACKAAAVTWRSSVRT